MNDQNTKKCGILMPIFSLPSKYGIGSFGAEAYNFVDFLKASNHKIWQVLPLNPTSFGDSPYQSPSAFAGNPYFIDLDFLLWEQLLTREECEAEKTKARKIDYGRLYRQRIPLLRKAYVRFRKTHAYEEFRMENEEWLIPYAEFMTLKEINGGKVWNEWCTNNAEIDEFWYFVQYLFYRQWNTLKTYANENGVEIIGDMPIYVAYDSAELSQKVKRGMRESCLKGNAAGIQPVFGYCIVDKKYKIVESEAAIVRKLFADYVSGTTIKELVEWLKISGIRSHRGNVFSFGRVSEMLHNPKYIGKCKYGGEVYENMIEPIIDEQTFYRAQEKLTENVHKAARSKAAEKFILSGKLICAECGELMVGESGTSKTGEIYTYYKCAAKKKRAQNCASKAIRKEVIEKAVYNAIIRALQDDTFICEVARKAVEIHNANIEESAELKILNRQKADIDKQLANITNAICQGIFNQHTQAKMIELSNTQQALEAQIADEQSKTILPLKEARVISFLKNYTAIVKCADKAESLDNMKRLFDVFIKEVIFDGERFLIVMKTTNEPLDPEKGQKEEATRKKFELLRFGDPYGNRTHDTTVKG